MSNLFVKFWFGETVYLKHCPQQLPRMVVDINFEGGPDRACYGLACGSERSLHYEAEISKEPDTVKLMNMSDQFER